jgi:MFS family permease
MPLSVKIVALTAKLKLSYLGRALHDPVSQTWIPNSLSLVQAVLAPVFSSASDIFQARKFLLCAGSAVSVVGAGVAARSHTLGSLLVGQTLIGVGFAMLPLAYVVPSEILPRKWRPFAQGLLNVFAYSAAVLGQLTMGAFIKHDNLNGWRNF